MKVIKALMALYRLEPEACTGMLLTQFNTCMIHKGGGLCIKGISIPGSNNAKVVPRASLNGLCSAPPCYCSLSSLDARCAMLSSTSYIASNKINPYNPSFAT